jgi:cyclohexanecarboxyl-CoA dehydrogenase
MRVAEPPPNPYVDDDARAVAAQARRFASERVAAGFLERDRTRVLDRELMREMGTLGFIAPELPEAVGGQGLPTVVTGVIHEEIARADLSISYINLLASLNGQILARCARPEVGGPWLERVVRVRRSWPSH